jgi:hypothetical protein
MASQGNYKHKQFSDVKTDNTARHNCVVMLRELIDGVLGNLDCMMVRARLTKAHY